jgi:hypothetical protein
MHPIDIEQFRARRSGKQQPAKRQPRRRRRKSADWFLKGPIPGAWLSRIFAMPAWTSGRALRVGLALWYRVGVKMSRTVKPTWETWRLFGISPDAARRGLADLEGVGLVVVDRRPGCCPVVTILDVNAIV